MIEQRRIILITGAARSGKSEWAETLALERGNPIIYVATSQVNSSDPEWEARIRQHRLRRSPDWQTLEVPVNLAETINTTLPPYCLLIDSLGTWVANLLTQDELTWEQTRDTFLKSLQQATIDVILVAEETGWGVVPDYPSGRLFRDRLGSLTRHLGALASPVYLVTGGHVLDLSLLGKRLR
jgi:adenosylcobinamide kinase/adenosylcobinamide-phosphate guanylyltransferase